MGRNRTTEIPDYANRFSPSAAWHLNARTGTITDLSGNSKTLTISGTNLALVAGPRGKLALGQAATGSGAYIGKADQSLKISGAMSTEMVLLTSTTITTGCGLMGFGAGNTSSNFNLQWSMLIDTHANGGICWYSQHSALAGDRLATNLTYFRATAEFFHLAFTRDGSNVITAYLNGVSVASGSLTAPSGGSDTTQNFWILQGAQNDAVGGTVAPTASQTAAHISYAAVYGGTVLTANQVAYLARLRLGGGG